MSTTLDAYWYTIRSTEPTSREREAELCRAARAGDVEARNELVSRNLRFAMDVAKDYVNQGLSLDELVSAANDGMLEAAERFDETRGFKFITYAVSWCRQRILLELALSRRAVRIPYNRVVDHIRAERRAATMEQHLGRPPMPSEVQAATGLTDVRWEAARVAGHTARSLDAPVHGEDDAHCSDLDVLGTVQAETPDPTDAVADEQLRAALDRLLGTLNQREREIIEMRFGLTGDEPMTLEVIGARLGVTRERARQLEVKVLAKLREHMDKRGLRAQLHTALVEVA